MIAVLTTTLLILHASTLTNLPASKAILSTDGSVISLSSGQIIIKNDREVTTVSIPGFKPNFILTRGESIYVVGSYNGFPAFARVVKGPPYSAEVTIVDVEGGELLFARLIDDNHIVFVGYVVLEGTYAPVVINYSSSGEEVVGAYTYLYRLPMYFRDVIKVNGHYVYLGGIAYGGNYYPLIVRGSSLAAFIPGIQTIRKGYHIKGILTANDTTVMFFMIGNDKLIIANATDAGIKSWLVVEGVNDAQLLPINGEIGQWTILAYLQSGKTLVILTSQTCIEFQEEILDIAYYDGRIIGMTGDLSLTSDYIQKSCPISKDTSDLRTLRDEVATHNVSCVRKTVDVESRVFYEEHTSNTIVSAVPSHSNTSLVIGGEYSRDVWMFEPNYYLMVAGILLIVTSYIVHRKLSAHY